MFKSRLKELRQEAGLSQSDVAEKVFLTQQIIGAYELGVRDPSSATLIALADCFNVSVDYLLGRTDER